MYVYVSAKGNFRWFVTYFSKISLSCQWRAAHSNVLRQILTDSLIDWLIFSGFPRKGSRARLELSGCGSECVCGNKGRSRWRGRVRAGWDARSIGRAFRRWSDQAPDVSALMTLLEVNISMNRTSPPKSLILGRKEKQCFTWSNWRRCICLPGWGMLYSQGVVLGPG